MPESLLSSSSVIMFGRVLSDLTITPVGAPNAEGNKLLHDRYSDADAKLARIYAISHAGLFRELSPLTIYLVHGAGQDPQPRDATNAETRKRSVAPDSVDATGVAGQYHQFSKDMVYWVYDKNDFTVRLEIESGMVEDVLLYPEMGDEMEHVSFGGGKVGGGKVGGGKVGGGKVGGGKVGGGKVGGGKVGVG